MIYRTYEEAKTTMNKYGLRIRDRWRTTAPTRYATIEDPENYFEELGEMVASQVEQLSASMAGPDPADETYLEKVARLTSATRLAEEQVMADLEWPEPELSETEARLEWEATQPSDESLVSWAISMDGRSPFEDELQSMAQEWMLPTSFLEELATSANPWIYLADHSETMTSSAEARFQRHRSS